MRDDNPEGSVAPANSSTTGFLSLPNEIIEQILSSLGPVSLMCTALICKRFYNLLIPRARCLLYFKHQKRKLLLRLEDDLPDMLLCHTCIKLYRWKVSKPRFSASYYFKWNYNHQLCPNRTKKDSLAKHEPGFVLCGDENAFRFHRETRDLILRYHRKGPEYGLPISYVGHTCRGEYPRNNTRAIQSTLTPKIVRGTFTIRRCEQLKLNLNTRFREQIHQFRDRICCHIGPPLPAIILCQIESIMAKLDFDWNAPYEPSPCHKCTKTIHCRYCNTDIRVKLEPKPDRTAIVRVYAWHNFGGRLEYLMGESSEFFDVIRPRRLAGREGYGFWIRDLEMFYNEQWTHPPEHHSRCRVISHLSDYVCPDQWTWMTYRGSFTEIRVELAEGPYRMQTHLFHSRKMLNLLIWRLFWFQIPRCSFSRHDGFIPFLKQVFLFKSTIYKTRTLPEQRGRFHNIFRRLKIRSS